MKCLLFSLTAFSMAICARSQKTPVMPPIKPDSNYIQQFFKNPKVNFNIIPFINIDPAGQQHGDVAMVNMPRSVLLFANKMGKVYEQPADKMRYLAPYNNSKMPVKK